MNTYELKEYDKWIELSNVQVERIIKHCIPNEQDANDMEHLRTILKRKCKIQVDRANKDFISIFTPYGVSTFSREDDNSARLLIMCIATARSYSHFYNNIEKKFGSVPKKPINKGL